MKEEYKTIIVGIGALIIGLLISSAFVDLITKNAFDHALELGIAKQQVSTMMVDTENNRKKVDIQKERVDKTQIQIDKLVDTVTGMSGEKAEERLELLKNLSNGLKPGSALERLHLLESKMKMLTSRSCSTEIAWGSVGSCGDHVDWISNVSCPNGKFISSIDIVADHVSNGWRCGFKIKCC